MARPAALVFDALTIEGALLSSAMLAKIASRGAGEQSEADYQVPKGLTLRDEIARYFRIGQALFAEISAVPNASVGRTMTFCEALLRDVFGFGDVLPVESRMHGGRKFPITLEALGGRVPVVVVPPADGLDRASDHLAGEGRRQSAASALQDWLNASEECLWGLCANGERLRLVRDNTSLTRPAYIEADLRQLFEGDAFADFAALWLILHTSRFGKPGNPPSDCPLERWREAGAREGLAARDRLRGGVEQALLALGNGFLSDPGNRELGPRILSGGLPLADFFNQLLRLVYRLIFLLAAEDRGLLHHPSASAAARRLYAEGYSLASLRDRAVRRAAWDLHHDRWQGLLVTFRALRQGEPKLGLPGLAGLFAADLLPDLEQATLANRALMEAVYGLAWLRDAAGVVPVNWRDMETEELGSVYESLLELTPRISGDGRTFSFAEAVEAGGHARKTTGSYYTPDSLVQALLDSALDPVLDRAEKEASDPATALLEVSVIDPACGSGHFLLAAGRRIATRFAHARSGGVASLEDYRHALRDVARGCLHGVDRNPMAVELTKVALWIETVEPGKPLGFLDANIRCGDSLLGVYDLEVLRQGIPDDAYRALAGDDPRTASYFRSRNREEREGQGALDFRRGGGKLPAPPPLADAVRKLRQLPEDTAADIDRKRRSYADARSDRRRWPWRVAADMYVAAFLTPKIGGVPDNAEKVTIPTTAHLWQTLAGGKAYGPLTGKTQEVAGAAGAFHWPLEFPEAMAAGGFDVVLGNPPWERIKLQEQEFFASREPEIAEAPNAAARGRLIAKLSHAEPGSRKRALYDEFEAAKRSAEAVSVFVRVPGAEGGRYALTGRGDVNTYALFAELFATLASPRGRAGVIVPTGIAADATTAPFFASLIEGKRLAVLIDFENRDGVFPAVHRSYKFSLLTIGRDIEEAGFAFFLSDTAQLAEPERRFTLSPDEIARINPNTKTAPVFRSRADAELTAKIYARVPVLIDETRGKDGNPWGISFARLFDMSNDSGLFRTAAQLSEAGYVRDGANWHAPEGLAPRQRNLGLAGGRDARNLDLQGGGDPKHERYVPLYEAKMIHQFDHRWATYDGTQSRDVTLTEKADPAFEPRPRYWVPESEVDARLSDKGWNRGWLMGWRDICRATDERTVIATAFPRTGVGNNLPLMLFASDSHRAKLGALVGCLSSLACDFFARHKVGGTHLNFFNLSTAAGPRPRRV
jgi:hypothetical protein